MLTQWNVVHMAMLRDEKMAKELLGLARPSSGQPTQLYQQFRSPQKSSGSGLEGGDPLRASTGANARRRWSFRALFAR